MCYLDYTVQGPLQYGKVPIHVQVQAIKQVPQVVVQDF